MMKRCSIEHFCLIVQQTKTNSLPMANKHRATDLTVIHFELHRSVEPRHLFEDNRWKFYFVIALIQFHFIVLLMHFKDGCISPKIY